MQTKYPCVLIHIKIRVRLILSKIFNPFQGSLFLWNIFVICVLCLSLSYFLVCSLQPCGHLAAVLALLCVMFSCVFVTFPYGILG